MVIFETDDEKDYFNKRMVIGEVARLVMEKIMIKLEKDASITKDEIFKFQDDSITELQEEVKKLNEQEKDGSFNEQAEDIVKKTEEVKKDTVKQKTTDKK